MSIIKTEHLVKTYTQGDYIIHAVDDVSLEIEKGEFTVICGPSGSGKNYAAKHYWRLR